MTTFERPAPDIDKIVAAWQTWTAGGEDVLPGRTMADLKIAGVDKVLETLAGDNDVAVPAFEAWMAWEKGKSTPQTAIDALIEAGFVDIVKALADAR